MELSLVFKDKTWPNWENNRALPKFNPISVDGSQLRGTIGGGYRPRRQEESLVEGLFGPEPLLGDCGKDL